MADREEAGCRLQEAVLLQTEEEGKGLAACVLAESAFLRAEQQPTNIIIS